MPRGASAVKAGVCLQIRYHGAKVGLQLPSSPGCGAGCEGGEGIAAAATTPSCPAVLIMTTDAGSDMAAGTAMLEDFLIRKGTNRWGCVRQYCLQHQLHLVVSKQLSGSERTWALLCMLTHLWRHHSSKFRLAFQAEMGETMDMRMANPPPLPVRGRWGTAHACEDRVLKHQRLALLAVPGAQLSPDRAKAFRRFVGARARATADAKRRGSFYVGDGDGWR